MRVLIFIPARAGSKGIKNKNLSNLKNKPLISYTFKIAKKLKKFRTFLSTDSKKIIKIGLNYGIKDNYIRPKKLSGSNSNIIDAVFHGLDHLKKNSEKFTHILLLQPTSPFRLLKDIKKIIDLLKKKKLESICSISRYINNPIYFVEKNNSSNWKYSFKKKKRIFNRQQVKKNFYIIDGSVYFASIKFLNKYKKFVVQDKTYLYQPNNNFNIDIDENLDLKIARKLLS